MVTLVAPDIATTQVTQLSFGGGAVLSLDNASAQSLTFAPAQATTAQTVATVSSSATAVVPVLTR